MLALMFLLSHAELIGSRGRCRKFGIPEPTDSDYDWGIFTDDQALAAKCLEAGMVLPGYLGGVWKIHFRKCGFTISSNMVDISVAPAARRIVTYEAWDLMQAGAAKEEAWVRTNLKYGLSPD